MARYEKILRKVRLNPKNVTITELIKLMELVGFSYRRGSKNHYVFYFKSHTLCVAPPHPGKYVKPIYVKLCLKSIDGVIKA